MSSHSKGARIERKCWVELEAQGWHPEKKNWSRFGAKDFWNVFDIIALKDGEVVAIQVKSNQARKGEVRAKFEAIRGHIPASWRVELWVYKDREGWKVFDLREI